MHISFAAALSIFGLYVGLSALYKLWVGHVAKQWTQVVGRIIEVSPQTFFERPIYLGASLGLNTDTDHFLEYKFNGFTFKHLIHDEASGWIGGIKIWRRKPGPDNLSIMVNPENPQQYYNPAHRRYWLYLLAFAGCCEFGALLCAIFQV